MFAFYGTCSQEIPSPSQQKKQKKNLGTFCMSRKVEFRLEKRRLFACLDNKVGTSNFGEVAGGFSVFICVLYGMVKLRG